MHLKINKQKLNMHVDNSLDWNIRRGHDGTVAAVYTVVSSFTFKVNRLFCHIRAPHALTANFPKRFVRCCAWFQDRDGKLLWQQSAMLTRFLL